MSEKSEKVERAEIAATIHQAGAILATLITAREQGGETLYHAIENLSEDEARWTLYVALEIGSPTGPVGPPKPVLH